jgi:hypothetical protein
MTPVAPPLPPPIGGAGAESSISSPSPHFNLGRFEEEEGSATPPRNDNDGDATLLAAVTHKKNEFSPFMAPFHSPAGAEAEVPTQETGAAGMNAQEFTAKAAAASLENPFLQQGLEFEL